MSSRGRLTRPLLHRQELWCECDLVVHVTGVGSAGADFSVEVELRAGVTLVTVTDGEATTIGEPEIGGRRSGSWPPWYRPNCKPNTSHRTGAAAQGDRAS